MVDFEALENLPEEIRWLLSAMRDGGIEFDVSVESDEDHADETFDDLPIDPPIPFEEDDPACAMCEKHASPEKFPEVESVIFSGPATTVFWSDGDKTTVKVAEGQTYDKYAGFCAAVCKKLFGSTSACKRVMDEHDAEAIRLRREAELKARRAEQEKKEKEHRARRVLNLIPSYDDFLDDVRRRALEMMVEKHAREMMEQVDQRLLIDQATEAITSAMKQIKTSDEKREEK